MSCSNCLGAPYLYCKDVINPNRKHLNIHTVDGLQKYLHSSESDLKKLKAAFTQSVLWPSPRTITVGFLSYNTAVSLNTSSWAWKRAWVAYVITQYFAPFVNVTFQFELEPTYGPNCDIRISFDPSAGCYSRLGTDALQNWGGLNETVNFGWMDAPLFTSFTYNGVQYTTPASFSQGGYPGQGTTIIHEFGHVMGMVHEHNTPFGLSFQWNTAAVYQYFQGPPNNWTKADVDQNVLFLYSQVGMNGSQFDSYSMMKFSFPGALLLNPTAKQISDAQRVNFEMSNCDKIWLSYNYPGRLDPSYAQSLNALCLANTANPVTPTPGPATPSPTTPAPTPPGPTSSVPGTAPTAPPVPTLNVTPSPTVTVPTSSPSTGLSTGTIVVLVIFFLIVFWIIRKIWNWFILPVIHGVEYLSERKTIEKK